MIKAPEFKTGNKSFVEALNKLLGFARKHGVNPAGRPGWSETEDGWMPPYISPALISGGSLWTLNVVDSASKEVSVGLGTILKDIDDASSEITITEGSSTFTAAVNYMLWLKLENPTTPTVTLEGGSGGWEGYGKGFSITGSGGTAEFEASYYPLYAFVGTATSETTPVSEGVHALKLAENSHLVIFNTVFQSETDDPVAGIYLRSGPRVSPISPA